MLIDEKELSKEENSPYYFNELAINFSKKLFLDFFILSYYFVSKLCKSRSLSFGLWINLFINFQIKTIQLNRIRFLTKLFLLNNIENIEKLKEEFKNEAKEIDSVAASDTKKLKENIFYQNLFFFPIVNQVALTHYSFKHDRFHLICFLGYCLMVLSNHFFCYYFASLCFRNSLHKLLPSLSLLFFDFFGFYDCFKSYQKLKKKEEERFKNFLL